MQPRSAVCGQALRTHSPGMLKAHRLARSAVSRRLGCRQLHPVDTAARLTVAADAYRSGADMRCPAWPLRKLM